MLAGTGHRHDGLGRVGRGGVMLSTAQRRQGGAGPGDEQTLLGGAGPTAGEEHG
jgi:hypothetical protein